MEKDGVEQVSNFVAKLLEEGANADTLNGDGSPLTPVPIATGSVDPKLDDAQKPTDFMGTLFGVPSPWPTDAVSAANDFDHGSQTGGFTSPTKSGVSCSVYKGTNDKYPGGEEKQLGYPNGVPKMQAWVGTDYPAKIASGASSYVTPGSGLLYTEVPTLREERQPVPGDRHGTALLHSQEQRRREQGRQRQAGAGPVEAPPRLRGLAPAADSEGLVLAAVRGSVAGHPDCPEAAVVLIWVKSAPTPGTGYRRGLRRIADSLHRKFTRSSAAFSVRSSSHSGKPGPDR